MKLRTMILIAVLCGFNAWIAHACYYLGFVLCHASGGPISRVIPAGYPCGGVSKSGTDDAAFVATAILVDPQHPSGKSKVQAATTGNSCVWGFNYTCGNNAETCTFSSSYQRYELDNNSSDCHQ